MSSSRNGTAVTETAARLSVRSTSGVSVLATHSNRDIASTGIRTRTSAVHSDLAGKVPTTKLTPAGPV